MSNTLDTFTEATDVADTDLLHIKRGTGTNSDKKLTGANLKADLATDFATAAQGSLADTALQPADIGTAAAEDVGYFATAAQGATADTALQPAAIGSTVQGWSAVLDATTASFMIADETKLDGIEALADVTDETNVVTALNGATLTAVVPAATDKILIQDASDTDNIKTITVDEISGSNELVWDIYIDTVADQDYEFTFDAPYAGQVDTLRTKTQSGTCTVTGYVNATPFGGTANSASSSAQEQTHVSNNTWSKGDTVKITVSSNSAALDLMVTLYGVAT